jgi:hypothetical protein
MEMTLMGFESYQLGSWFRNGLVVRATPSERSTDTKRDMPWTVQLVASVSIGVASALFSAGSSADTISGSVQRNLAQRSFGSAPLAPLSFLFESIKSGQVKTPNDEMRSLANRAVEIRSQEISSVEAWAGRLANDVKDAED